MANSLKSIDDISKLVQADEWMIRVLTAAEQMNLPAWWIGAGFLRNKIWDYLEGKTSEPTRDVDLVYFDSSKTETADWELDEKANTDFPFAKWEIRNQARMHHKNGFNPFSSTADGIAHWTETATAIAVRMNSGELDFLFCYGTNDLFSLVARPTPYCLSGPMLQLFLARIKEKGWQQRWPSLQVVDR